MGLGCGTHQRIERSVRASEAVNAALRWPLDRHMEPQIRPPSKLPMKKRSIPPLV
jgi:hypothetical protein